MANKTEKIAVLGAGTMGAGIAQVAAQGGFETCLRHQAGVYRHRNAAGFAAFLQGSRERGKITAEQEQEILERLHGTTRDSKTARTATW